MTQPKHSPEIRITVSTNGMEAYAEVLDLARPPSRAALHGKLENYGIVEGILEAAIEQLTTAPPPGPILVAQGYPPEPGQPARIEYYFATDPEAPVPLEGDDGRVDHREARAQQNVTQGQVLARKIPATLGRAGRTVRGSAIPAQPGRNTTLMVGKHVRLSGDQLEAIAEIAGFPEICRNRIAVRPVLEVEDVDFDTGNLHFQGSIIVHGNVTSGFAVHALEDILVRGVVEGGHLEAGGNIKVEGTVRARSLVKAQGSIQVRYVDSDSILIAGDNIRVEDDALHSRLEAGAQVLIGRHLIGGEVRAGTLIQATRLGTIHHTRTRLELVPPRPDDELAALAAEIGEVELQLTRIAASLQQAMTRGGSDSAATLKRLTPAKIRLTLRLKELRRRYADLSHAAESPIRPRIVVRDECYPGVLMVLDERIHRLRERERSRTYTVVEGQLRVFSSTA